MERSNTLGPGRPGVPEYLFCNVQKGNSPPILVAVIYKPSDMPMQKNTALFSVLRDLASEYSHKIIMRDLNANLLSTSGDAITIRRLTNELSLQIVQHGPTHRTSTSHTWIDLILTDENDTILDHNNEWLPSFEKHSVIDTAIDIYSPCPVKEPFSYRDYNSICPAALNNALFQCDWSAMSLIENDLEGALNSLNDNQLVK